MSKHSTSSPSGGKASPQKPSKDFPLSIHKGTGYWCKKVRGRVYYFGKVADDPKGTAALETWLKEKDDLQAGREPREKTTPEDITLEEMCFRFLEYQEGRLQGKVPDISPRTYQGYFATAKNLADAMGRHRLVADLVQEDFKSLRKKLAETRGLVALRNEIIRVRSIFKFALKAKLITSPAEFGVYFELPKDDVIRRTRQEHRNEHGDRMFEAEEIRLILAACNQPMKTMVLLAANGGLGQSDLARMPTRVIDLEKGWFDFARVKTGVPRIVPLWPETVEAIREWLKVRPKAKNSEDGKLLFLTRFGTPYIKLSKPQEGDKDDSEENKKDPSKKMQKKPGGVPDDAIGKEFGKILRKLNLKRPRLSFYGLRHGFATIAGDTGDQVAVNAIMGHTDSSMAGTYRERVDRVRLVRVVEHVRQWLFGATPSTPDDDPDLTNVTNRTTDPSPAPSDPSEGPQEPQPSLRLYVG